MCRHSPPRKEHLLLSDFQLNTNFNYFIHWKTEKRSCIGSVARNAARIMVKKAGELAGVNLRPHDLRRHAATHASRSGTPIEIVSKVILRHAHLSTTQRYLEKATDGEAIRWIENLYA